MNRAAFLRRIGAVVLAANIGLRPWRLEAEEDEGVILQIDESEYPRWKPYRVANETTTDPDVRDWFMRLDSYSSPTVRMYPYPEPPPPLRGLKPWRPETPR